MRRLNWKRERCSRVDIGRHVRSAAAECGTYFAATYRQREGEWWWGVGIVDTLAITDDGDRCAAVTTYCNGEASTMRRAMRAARKALAKMGLR